jgi:hypothetical protein
VNRQADDLDGQRFHGFTHVLALLLGHVDFGYAVFSNLNLPLDRQRVESGRIPKTSDGSYFMTISIFAIFLLSYPVILVEPYVVSQTYTLR